MSAPSTGKRSRRRVGPRRSNATPPPDRARAKHLPGEFELIRRMTGDLPAGGGVIVGPGDDAAVLRPETGDDLVATTDSFVEGVHWLPDLLDATSLGHRFAAANLSDLAAMAAVPRWALLAVGAPPDAPAEWLEAFERGLAAALAAHGATVVGGNLTRERTHAWFTLTLIGEVARGRAWTRRGARPGDLLAVTGSPGRAGAALAVGAAAHRVSFTAAACEPLLRAHREPSARVEFARALAETGAVTAAIDLSDGFHGDLTHLAAASAVGAEVDETLMPRDETLVEAARLLLFQRAHGAGWSRARRQWVRYTPSPARLTRLATELHFGPSDDYELMLAIDPAHELRAIAVAQATRTPLAIVGRFHDMTGVLTIRDGVGRTRPLPGHGWDHFRG
jgi:thiamine-monophosphate kinase